MPISHPTASLGGHHISPWGCPSTLHLGSSNDIPCRHTGDVHKVNRAVGLRRGGQCHCSCGAQVPWELPMHPVGSSYGTGASTPNRTRRWDAHCDPALPCATHPACSWRGPQCDLQHGTTHPVGNGDDAVCGLGFQLWREQAVRHMARQNASAGACCSVGLVDTDGW